MGMQNLSLGSGPSNTRSDEVGGWKSKEVVDGLLCAYMNLGSSRTHDMKQGTENSEGMDSQLSGAKTNENSSDIQAIEVQEIMEKRICERASSNLRSNISNPCVATTTHPYASRSQFGRFKEIVRDLYNTLDMDYFSLGPALEEAMKHKEHTLAAGTDDELIEESPCEDLEFSLLRTEDVGHAMISPCQPSGFEAIKSLPQQVEEETVVVDTSDQKLMLLKDNFQIQQKSFAGGVEKVQFASKTCIKARVSKPENKSEEIISFGSISQHFGKSLDDAAKSFGVSRSTFKRKCRALGIERWQPGKRGTGENISSKLTRKINEDTVLARTSQDSNKVTVKATCDDRTIRFKLPVISGIVDLEDNVIKRLRFKRKRFSIKYQDDEGDWVLIACDKDVRECMKISRSSEKTTIRLLLDKPIHCAP